MGRPVIRVQDVSKMYQLGQIGTGTFSRDLERWFVTKILRKEDPFAQIGEVNDRSTAGNSNIVWSLKDVSLDIQQGDAVGIIGRNGAGKSTLLKLLSRVTAPTTGKISVKGRIASLLEVGTGFHPELSGRENIYLNGAILGMRKREIDRKFDEIVDFSGVERYIDTPVKRYSSGMYVRLAFAVAAHLDSEILVVDEVMAVGDAEFQKKCLGKMSDVSTEQGRTVLFVSHNMAAIQGLCRQCIYLQNGQVQYYGANEKALQHYLKAPEMPNGFVFPFAQTDGLIEFIGLELIDESGAVFSRDIQTSEVVGVKFIYKILTKEYDAKPSVILSTELGLTILHLICELENNPVNEVTTAVAWFPKDLFNDEVYTLTAAMVTSSLFKIHFSNDIRLVIMENPTDYVNRVNRGKLQGIIRPKINWTHT